MVSYFITVFVIANNDFENLLMVSFYRIDGDSYEAHITLILSVVYNGFYACARQKSNSLSNKTTPGFRLSYNEFVSSKKILEKIRCIKREDKGLWRLCGAVFAENMQKFQRRLNLRQLYYLRKCYKFAPITNAFTFIRFHQCLKTQHGNKRIVLCIWHEHYVLCHDDVFFRTQRRPPLPIGGPADVHDRGAVSSYQLLCAANVVYQRLLVVCAVVVRHDSDAHVCVHSHRVSQAGEAAQARHDLNGEPHCIAGGAVCGHRDVSVLLRSGGVNRDFGQLLPDLDISTNPALQQHHQGALLL